MPISFIHFSDTHLGYHDLELLDDNGRNIREEDIYKSMEQIVDDIIQKKPDFVLHTGDIFHRSTPTNRAIDFAYLQIKRIVNEKIPFFMIAGNHDFPKTVFTTPIHRIFSDSEFAHIFYDEKYKVHEEENYIIHAFPHINFDEEFLEETAKIEVKNKDKFNILMMHLSMENYLMEEFGERVFPKEYYDVLKDFDYVALGHWHNFNYLKRFGNVYYTGSSEKISERDYDKEKGYIFGSLNNDEVNVEFVPVITRQFLNISIDGCSEKEKETILEEVKVRAEKVGVSEKIVKIFLNDLLRTQLHDFRNQDFDEILTGALDFQVVKYDKESGEKIATDRDSFDLKGELVKALEEEFPEKKDFEKVKQISLRILDKIEEDEADANQ